jgi:hypothetical protein
MFFAKLKFHMNKNLDKKLDSLNFDRESIKVGFKGKDGEMVYKTYRAFHETASDNFESRESELQRAIISNLNKLKSSDLVILALRLNNESTQSEMKDTLASWGKPSGQWFYASGVVSRLVQSGLIQKIEGSGKVRVSRYILTKGGIAESDRLVNSVLNFNRNKKLPFILQRIIDRGVRKIRLFYVTRNIERCVILFNSTPLVWDIGKRTERTIGEGGGGNVVIPESIFREDGIVTVRYDGETIARKYKDLVEADP